MWAQPTPASPHLPRRVDGRGGRCGLAGGGCGGCGMKWARACFVVLLVGTARAQVPDARAPRDASARWAEYYAAVYQVPVELVAAIIDEESGWNPYAVSKKGAAGDHAVDAGNSGAVRRAKSVSGAGE